MEEMEVTVTPDVTDSTHPSTEELPVSDIDTTAAEAAPADVYLPVYNGEIVRVEAGDTQRVTGLLQKGLRFEQFAPQFERLKTIGRALGCSKPEEAVEYIAMALEQAQYEGILQEVGGNEAIAKELLAARSALPQDKPEPDAAALLNERLADEFLALKAAYPEAGDWDKLPDRVLQQAAQSGRSLTDCWLQYRHDQQMRIDDAKTAAARAAAGSVGSLRSMPDTGVEAASRSFLAGFRSRL